MEAGEEVAVADTVDNIGNLSWQEIFTDPRLQELIEQGLRIRQLQQISGNGTRIKNISGNNRQEKFSQGNFRQLQPRQFEPIQIQEFQARQFQARLF